MNHNSNKGNLLLIAMILLFSFFVTSCEQPEEPEPQKYLGKFYIGEMKNYTFFKPGSMWVYECDSTGELDTQVMLKCYTWWISTDYIDYEVMSFQRKSLNEGSLYSEFIMSSSIPYNANNKKRNDHLEVEKSHPDRERATESVFFTPYDTTKESSAGYSITKYVKLITNYKINNFTFDTVRVFRARPSTSHPITNHPFYKNLKPYTVIDYYFAKNVGIVQLQIIGYNNQGENIPKNHNWNLNYYKIIN
ncbi:MAG: hypothetical protein RL059_1285 [Bacteroidota bacterium]